MMLCGLLSPVLGTTLYSVSETSSGTMLVSTLFGRTKVSHLSGNLATIVIALKVTASSYCAASPNLCEQSV
uniref:Putative secreted protein n=1 Tax=Anopheles darlingi TaxID=43151 RepID=A0A2M4DG07_ANODA